MDTLYLVIYIVAAIAFLVGSFEGAPSRVVNLLPFGLFCMCMVRVLQIVDIKT